MAVFFVRTLLLVPGATAGVGGGNGRGRRAPLRGVALLARGGHGVPGGGWLSLTPRALSLVRVLPDQCTPNSFEGRKARPTLSSSKLCRFKIQKAVSSVYLNKFLSIHSDEKTGFFLATSAARWPDGEWRGGCAHVSGNRKGGTPRGRGGLGLVRLRAMEGGTKWAPKKEEKGKGRGMQNMGRGRAKRRRRKGDRSDCCC